jgi:hypothetical protein
MKATRIALALGAFVSVAAGTAAAQTPLTYSVNGANLTLYGNVDYYLNYQKSSSGSHITSLQDGAYLSLVAIRYGGALGVAWAIAGVLVVQQGVTLVVARRLVGVWTHASAKGVRGELRRIRARFLE